MSPFENVVRGLERLNRELARTRDMIAAAPSPLEERAWMAHACTIQEARKRHLETFQRLLREERARGVAGHWGYVPATHIWAKAAYDRLVHA